MYFIYVYIYTYQGHRCDGKGCDKILVKDGNMKNYQEVCFAKDAGFIEYNGLQGKVKTGCPNTPDLKSWFCALHKPIAAATQEVQLTGEKAQASTSTCSEHTPPEEQIAINIAKKQTRQTTFYQVGVEIGATMWKW